MVSTAYPRKTLDLLDVVLEHWRLLPVVKTIELGDVINLDIVFDSISKSGPEVSTKSNIFRRLIIRSW